MVPPAEGYGIVEVVGAVTGAFLTAALLVARALKPLLSEFKTTPNGNGHTTLKTTVERMATSLDRVDERLLAFEERTDARLAKVEDKVESLEDQMEPRKRLRAIAEVVVAEITEERREAERRVTREGEGRRVGEAVGG